MAIAVRIPTGRDVKRSSTHDTRNMTHSGERGEEEAIAECAYGIDESRHWKRTSRDLLTGTLATVHPVLQAWLRTVPPRGYSSVRDDGDRDEGE